MTFRQILSVTFVSTVMLCACTNETEESSVENEYVSSVRVSVERFKDDLPTTRTNHILTSTGLDVQWAEGDALGIYPIGGDQVKFPLSSGNASAYATFDGGAWKMRSGVQYAAYYPFSKDNYTISQTAIPVNYTGQTQNGNNTTSHLGAYDFLACAASTPNANGEINLQMKHLGAILRLQLTMPKADSYKKVVLESNGTYCFVEKGHFDLTSAIPAVNSTTISDSYTINLTNVSTTKNNETITIYAMAAPAKTGNMTVTVYSTDGWSKYSANVDSKEFVAGGACTITANLTLADHDYVDLDLPSGNLWATCNVGAEKPEELGYYFAWGETSTKSSYSLSNYKWYNGSDGSFSKYGNYDELSLSDDAAYVNWGSNWRMPNYDDLSELITSYYTTTVETTQNGVKGLKITSRSNGNSIFLPAAGYMNGSTLAGAGTNVYYWSSDSYDQGRVCYLRIVDGNATVDYCSRYMGQSIRPVRNDE